MASGTVYIPQVYPLDASKVSGFGQGASATCGANTTTNIDLLITDDCIITGLELIISGASKGDYVALSVLVSGVAVATPIPGPWYLPQNGDNIFDLSIPIKLVSGMTLRAAVTTTVVLVTPFVAINYKLWKVLV